MEDVRDRHRRLHAELVSAREAKAWRQSSTNASLTSLAQQKQKQKQKRGGEQEQEQGDEVAHVQAVDALSASQLHPDQGQTLVVRNLFYHVPVPQPSTFLPKWMRGVGKEKGEKGGAAAAGGAPPALDASSASYASSSSGHPSGLSTTAISTATTATTTTTFSTPSMASAIKIKVLTKDGLREADIERNTSSPSGNSRSRINGLESMTILSDISLSVLPGQVLAILGSSGSGKTTLLDVLACRGADNGIIEGDITLNGRTITTDLMKEVAGYVVQDDRLLPNLTVRETLTYVALLRLPASMSYDAKISRVEAVIAELGLRSVSNTRIGGNHMRGVSGGERRRVSIGVQLLLDPYLLFLDEPTSGLDSFNAANIVSTLSLLAKSNRTVIFTIHQPRSDVFELFDRILVLSKGRTIYCGPAKHMVPWFDQRGFPCPKFSNPCDFCLDLCTVDYRSEDAEKESLQRVTYLADAFANRALDFFNKHDQEELKNWSLQVTVQPSTNATVLSAHRVNSSRTSNRISKLQQFYLLYLRASKNILQGTSQLIGEFVSTVFMGLLLGVIFYQLGRDQLSVNDRFGFFYIICSLFPFMVILDTIAKVDSERPSFYNERQDGMYDLLPYVMAKMFAELPFNILFAIIYLAPLYAMSNLQVTLYTIGMFALITFLVVYCSRSLALLMATVFPVFQKACFYANLSFTMFLLPSGFLVNLDTLWPGVSWISHVSYIRLGFEALSIVEFSGLNFTCSTNTSAAHSGLSVLSSVPMLASTFSSLALENGTVASNSTACPIPDGQAALNAFALTDSTIQLSLSVLCVLIVGFRAIAYLALRFINQKPRDH